MRIKNIFSAAMAALMISVISAVPVYAVDSLQQDSEELNDGTFTYELVNGTYTITKCDERAIVEEVPNFRNGFSVTAIANNAFANCTLISKLVIPDSIKTIGSSAFAGCTSLKEIELPNTIETLSNGIFMGCTQLDSVDIPDSVNTIESYAFYNCSALAEVKLPGSLSSVKPMAFAECSTIENIDADACGSYVFEDGILYNSSKTNIYRASTKLTGDVYIENSVTAIEPGAFSVCAGIENLFLPSSVTYIGDDAFGYCVGLKKIDFSEGLVTINPGAFKNCSSLQTLDFPTTLQEIGEGAFYNCSELSRVIIPEGTVSIGTGVFASCSKLEQVSIPKSVTEIGENAFGYDLNSDGSYVLNENFKLSVYSGSEGAKYARSNKIEHSAVDKSLKTVAFIAVGAGLILAAAVFAVVLMARSRKGAPMSVKKADKLAKEKEEEENYKKIIE